MSERCDYAALAPGGLDAMRGLAAYADASDLEPRLRYLVELRISQINGCAYCVDLHYREALEAGETPRRLNGLVVWREAPFFEARERAAFAWAEAVTLVAEGQVPDEVYREARLHFSEKELVDLTYVVIAMNAWNRLAVSFRQLPT
ncbi:MAG: carboxymuconolactone decarboxylase family protein [Dongiaceae bacterium]